MTSTQQPDVEQLELAEPGAHRQQTRPAAPVLSRTGARRVFLGPAGNPGWARPLHWLLLLGTALFYLVNLTGNGYANDFYAAAVKSSTQSWKAWLFASLDSGNAITVDKPPGAMWVMGLSARIFGFSSASMLIPEALMGVATVALVYGAVKRWSGPAAGLVAGALVALTPVAALMFRFNNPDAFLVLLMTAAAYCVVRAIEAPAVVPAVRSGEARAAEAARPEQRKVPLRARALTWLLLAGAAIGFAFLTKMLQGLLVLPGFAIAYLWAAPSRLWTRIWHLLAALGAVIVAAGWFVVLVALWPAGSRPYIGGSTDNSLWELAIGYNGLGRIFGGSGNGGGGGTGGGFGGAGGGGAAFGGTTGLGRMFGTSFGSQISWLIPAALLALLAGLVLSARSARTDRTRASLLLWGGWLVVSGLVFSFMEGTVHPYYSVALAPGIAGLVAIGGRELWRGRANHVVRVILAAMIAVTAIWSFHLMQRDAASWKPWIRDVTLVGGLVGAVLLVASIERIRRLAVVGLLVGSVTALTGMTAFAVQTVATDHTGSTPTAGPATAGGFGGVGGFGGGRIRTGGTGGFGGFTGEIPDGAQIPTGAQAPGGTSGTAPGTTGGTVPGATGGTGAFAPGGAGGGFGDASATESGVVTALEATTSRWAAAAIGANSADGYILSTDKAIMAIGGFTGSDPSPTLAQFQQYVAQGDIAYFIAGGRGGGFGGAGGNGTSSQISSWVEQNFTATTVGSTTLYDLRKPAAATTGG
ncbi:4-amino-4-deoxy-L-arabinose transferase-like glycosyltransferase [Nakamurella sp. UYEF19]|uniref:ArnT family glycosyltransferase n=1 Tax=Nakamurella sp. UYEF19 TaxID=1756392 RepID=UPI003399EFCB